MITCPNCKKYELSFWDRVSLHNYRPSQCPKCEEYFVNHTAASLLSLLSCIAVVATLMTIASKYYQRSDLLFLVALAGFPALALFTKPIRYADFKPYGKRSWWKNVLIFVLLPLTLMTLILYLLVVFDVGMQ
jgi:hypothetical protein